MKSKVGLKSIYLIKKKSVEGIKNKEIFKIMRLVGGVQGYSFDIQPIWFKSKEKLTASQKVY